MPRTRRTAARDARRILDMTRCCEIRMRRPTPTMRAISAETGWSLGKIHDLLRDATAAVPRANAEELRDRRVKQLEAEVARMGRLLKAYEEQALGGSFDAAELLVKASGKRADVVEKAAKVEGSMAPVRQELTGKDGGPVATAAVDMTKLSDAQIDALSRGDTSVLAGEGGDGAAQTPGVAPRLPLGD